MPSKTNTLELTREVVELRVQLSSTTFEYNWQIAIQKQKGELSLGEPPAAMSMAQARSSRYGCTPAPCCRWFQGKSGTWHTHSPRKTERADFPEEQVGQHESNSGAQIAWASW